MKLNWFEDCFWYMYTTWNASIAIHIVNMDIERSDGCLADYLALIDGPTLDHQESIRLCGTPSNITLESSGPEAILRFHSNDIITGAGFNATYYQKCGSILKENDNRY